MGVLADDVAAHDWSVAGAGSDPFELRRSRAILPPSEATSRADGSTHWRSNSEFHQSAGLARARLSSRCRNSHYSWRLHSNGQHVLPPCGIVLTEVAAPHNPITSACTKQFSQPTKTSRNKAVP